MIEIISEGIILEIVISNEQNNCRCICATDKDAALISDPKLGIIYN